MCLDSRIAQADTFLSQDVPAWIDQTLDVDPDHRQWAAGGFSFGGTCAVQMVTRHPEIYGSALAFSSEQEPAIAKEREKTIEASFGGDTEAFERLTPLRLMAERRFEGHGDLLRRRRPGPRVHGLPGRALRGRAGRRLHRGDPRGRQRRPFLADGVQRTARRASNSWPPGGASGSDARKQSPRAGRRAGAASPGASCGRGSVASWPTSGPSRSHWRCSPSSSSPEPSPEASSPDRRSSCWTWPRVSAPGLKAGQWWSLFTSMFFATNLLAYLSASLMILLLLGLAERRLGSRRTAVFFFAGQFAAITLFLLLTQLARYAGDGWLGLMVDARLIGPYAAVLAASLASSGLLPTLWQRRLRTAVLSGSLLLVLYVGHAGNGRGTGRGAGRDGGGLVDPGRQGHAAPAPLHRARNPQPAGPHRGDLRGGTHPHRRGPQPHRAAGPAAGRRPEPAAHAQPAGAELRRHDRRRMPGGGPGGLRRAAGPGPVRGAGGAAAHLRGRHAARPPARPPDRRAGTARGDGAWPRCTSPCSPGCRKARAAVRTPR